jgi:hypothetical protein
MVLMVDEDAAEEIKNAALYAGDVDFKVLQIALGISKG